MHSLLGDIPTANKQAVGREGGPAGILLHVSNSNLNNIERALKKFKASIEELNMARQVYKYSSFSGYSLNDYENP